MDEKEEGFVCPAEGKENAKNSVAAGHDADVQSDITLPGEAIQASTTNLNHD